MMRIMATGDTHISKGMATDVLWALDQILDLARDEKPDVMVLAGDITDVKGHTDPFTVQTCRTWVRHLAQHCGQVLVIPGNHEIDLSGGRDNLTAILTTHDHGVMQETGEQSSDWKNVHVLPQNKIGHVYIEKGDLVALGVPNPTGKMSPQEMEQLIKAEKEEAEATHDPVGTFCFFHGATVGATRGNEMEMPRGYEANIPLSAFDGMVMAHGQHIHQHSIEHSPDGTMVVHGGAPLSLAYGDRVEPGVMLYTISDGELVDWDRLPITAAAQRITTTLTHADLNGSTVQQAATAKVREAAQVKGEVAGVKVRLIAKLPAGLLGELDHEWMDRVSDILGLNELKLIKETADKSSGLETMGPAHKADVIQAVSEWADLDDSRKQHKDAIIELAKLIETEGMDVIDDPHYDLEPLELHLSNWKQWDKVSFNLAELGQLTVITGANASGKSNLLEAEAFALYGKLIKGGTLADAIKQGEKKAQVAFTFNSHGHEYRITRLLKAKSANGVASASQELKLHMIGDIDHAEGVWLDASSNSIKETEAKIADLVGPWSFYRLTRYASERDLEELVAATPSQMAGILEEMLDLNLEGRAMLGKKQASMAQEARLNRQGQLEQVSRDVEGLEGLQEQLMDLDGKKVQLWQQRDEISGELEKLDAMLEQAIEEHATAKADAESIRAKKVELEGIDVDADAMVATMEGIKKTLQQKRDQKTAKQAELDEIHEVDDGEARASLDDAKNGIMHTRARLSSARERLGELQDEHTNTLSEGIPLKESLEQAKKMRETLTTVPCKGEILWKDMADDDGWNPEKEVDCSTCRFLEEAQAVQPDALEAKLIPLRSKLQKIQREMALLKAQLTEDEQRMLELEGKKEKAERDINTQHRADVLRLEIHNLQEDIKSWSERLGEAESAHAKAVSSHAHNQAHIEKLEKDLHKANQLLRVQADELDAMRHKKISLQAALKSVLDSTSEVANEMATITMKVEMGRAALESMAKLEDEISHFKKDEEVASLYVQAMGKQGISYLMLKRAVPRFQELANAFLEPMDLRYQLATSAQVTKGWRDQLNQLFHDHRGTHPVCESSGFQRKILGMSLRVALALTHAELTGSKLFQIVQDEGWGAFDPDNLGKAAAMLRGFLSQIQGRMIIITHIPLMREVADTKLEVIQGPDGPMITESAPSNMMREAS